MSGSSFVYLSLIETKSFTDKISEDLNDVEECIPWLHTVKIADLGGISLSLFTAVLTRLRSTTPSKKSSKKLSLFRTQGSSKFETEKFVSIKAGKYSLINTTSVTWRGRDFCWALHCHFFTEQCSL